jgi:hypothetical protein
VWALEKSGAFRDPSVLLLSSQPTPASLVILFAPYILKGSDHGV